MRTVLRVLIGFVVACFAGALTTLLFVYTPGEVLGWLTSLPAEERSERFSVFGLLWLAAATQSALFSLLFAVISAVIGEWRRIRSLTYYAGAGVVIAVLGFAAQWMAEPTGQNWSVVNSNYPLIAFLTTGFVAGIAYWIVAGRHAGRPSPAIPASQPVVEEKPKDAPKPDADKATAAGSTAEATPKA